MKTSEDDFVKNVAPSEILLPETIKVKEERIEDESFDADEETVTDPLVNIEASLKNETDNESLEPGEIPYETHFFETKKEKMEVEENMNHKEKIVLKKCYVNLHKGLNQREIARCKKCRKLDKKPKFLDDSEHFSDDSDISMETGEESNSVDEDLDALQSDQSDRYNQSTDGSQEEGENSNSEDEIVYKCQYCLKKYIHMGSYKTHLRTTHNVYSTNYGTHHLQKKSKSSKKKNSPTITIQKNQCFLCQMEFTDPEKYLNHLESHEKSKKSSSKKLLNLNHKCHLCERTFETKERLDRHILTHRDREKPFKCPQCNLRFCTDFRLKNHLGEIHKEKLFECEVCGFKSNSQSSIKSHSKKKHVKTKGGEKKGQLGGEAIVKEEVLDGDKEVNEIEEVIVEEAVAGEATAGEATAGEATVGDATEGEATAGEATAGGATDQVSILNQETNSTPQTVKYVQLKNLLPQLAEEPKGSTTVIIIPEEFLIDDKEANEIQENFMCKFCHKLFILKKDLNLHVEKHLSKPYKGNNQLGISCTDCGIVFPTIFGLKRHIRRAHDLKCWFCNEIFPSRNEFNAHRVNFHSGQNLQCDICLKTFTRRSYFNRHVKYIHSPVRYDCDNCKKMFKHKQSLILHLEKCSKLSKKNVFKVASVKIMNVPKCVSSHNCGECGEEFQTAQDLEKHLVLGHFLSEPCDCGNCDDCISASTSNFNDNFLNLPDGKENQCVEAEELIGDQIFVDKFEQAECDEFGNFSCKQEMDCDL